MRPNPQAADPFGRPDLATRTTLIWASRTTATPGSVWPTRAGSDQAALDTFFAESTLYYGRAYEGGVPSSNNPSLVRITRGDVPRTARQKGAVSVEPS